MKQLTDKALSKLTPQQRAAYDARRAHHERWGHLPVQLQSSLAGVRALANDAVENHARTLNTDPVHFAAVRAFYRWPIGQEMDVDQYAKAVEHVLTQRHGY